MKYLKKFTAALLAAMLLLSACSGGDTSWAFRSGQAQISPGLYILYEITAFSESEEKIAENLKENFVEMNPAELLKQTVEDKLASDWIRERATELAREHITVYDKFTELGLMLNDAELASIESSVGSVKASGSDFYEKNGVSEVTLREYYTNYVRMSRVFLTLYGEGGELAVSEDELKKYFAENYAKIDVLLMYKPVSAPEGETKTVEQLTSEMKTDAQDYLARLKAGEEIEELAYEWQKKSVSAEQQATVTKPEKGQLSMIIPESARESYGDALTDAVIKAKTGDADMVDDEAFFLVFKKLDIMESPDEFDGYKSTVLQELKGDEFESKLADWGAAVQLETNNATLDRYKPEKIKFDTK